MMHQNCVIKWRSDGRREGGRGACARRISHSAHKLILHLIKETAAGGNVVQVQRKTGNLAPSLRLGDVPFSRKMA